MPAGARQTVLIIDDEPVTRMLVRQVLEGSGYEVQDAEDGEAGMVLVRESMPDLILCDVRMPRLNGFETCKAVRELDGGRHVPILMLTGLDDVVSAQLAFESGATDFITKPINWALLAQRLRYALHAKQQEEQLRKSEVRLAHAQQLARLGQWQYVPDVDEVSISPEFIERLGFGNAAHARHSRTVRRLVHARDRRRMLVALDKVLRDGEAASFDFQLECPEGRLCTLHLFAERACVDGKQVLQGTLQDITARIEAEARLSYYSHYDRLTDLPNRVLFWDRLTQNIAEYRRSGKRFAVLLIDLDRFSALNASLGHAKGDRILQLLAQRLSSQLRASDTLSRIGGDEFAVICPGLASEHELRPLLTRITACFDDALRDDGIEAFVSASIGVALFPQDGGDMDTLLMNADAAKSRAATRPGCNYQFYTMAMDDNARERLALETALRRGLQDEAFFLHYQPLLNLRDSSVRSVEALLRWNRPEVGVVMPSVFIPILEETGLLQEVGEWVIRRACEELLGQDLLLSINLSPLQFLQHDLVDRISQILAETGYRARNLQLEVTENVLIEDSEKAAQTLASLRKLGIRVAIDDFGTGFASLTYLKHYNADFLKIDRTFVTNLARQKSNLAIVRSTIVLGHDLDMGIVGEGVEQVSDLEILRDLGCDFAQGFLIARPLAADALRSWLAER